MKTRLFNTRSTWGATILRCTLGLIVIPHGAQKLLGWFGGYGFNGTMQFFTDQMHLPWLIGFLVIFIEFFGALLLLTGFATRFAGLAIIALMTGIVYTSHIGNGFFMNWYGVQGGEGFEYHLLVIGMALTLLVTGSGNMSVDKLIAKSMKTSK